jgi:hypothetical protein
MATRKISTRKSTPKKAQRNSRIISLTEVESFGATEVKKAYIEELNGYVSYKNTKAKGVIKFMEAENTPTQLRAMANFISCSYCTEEGEFVYSSEDAVIDALTRQSIEAIALGIAKAWQGGEGESEGSEGNA